MDKPNTAPAATSLNDDDVYLYNRATKRVVCRIPCSDTWRCTCTLNAHAGDMAIGAVRGREGSRLELWL